MNCHSTNFDIAVVNAVVATAVKVVAVVVDAVAVVVVEGVFLEHKLTWQNLFINFSSLLFKLWLLLILFKNLLWLWIQDSVIFVVTQLQGSPTTWQLTSQHTYFVTVLQLSYRMTGLDLTKQMYLWLIQHKQSKQAKQVPKIGDPPFSYDLSLRRLTDDKPAMIPGANII